MFLHGLVSICRFRTIMVYRIDSYIRKYDFDNVIQFDLFEIIFVTSSLCDNYLPQIDWNYF